MPVELPVSVLREADTTISFDDAKWTSGVTSRPSTCAVTVVCWYGDSEQPQPVHMFMWFHRQQPEQRFVFSGDFGFRDSIAEISQLWRTPVERRDVLGYRQWPFVLEDMGGLTLPQRLRERMAPWGMVRDAFSHTSQT